MLDPYQHSCLGMERSQSYVWQQAAQRGQLCLPGWAAGSTQPGQLAWKSPRLHTSKLLHFPASPEEPHSMVEQL